MNIKNLIQSITLSPLIMVFILLVCDYNIKSLAYVRLSPILWMSTVFWNILIAVVFFSSNYFEKKQIKKELNNGYYELYYKFNIKENIWSITYVYYVGIEQMFELLVTGYNKFESVLKDERIITTIDKPVYKVITDIEDGVQTITTTNVLSLDAEDCKQLKSFLNPELVKTLLNH